MRTALIAGGSGLIGGFLLRQLLASPEYDRVISLGRRPLDLTHPKLTQLTTDFTALDQLTEELRAHDAFCVLGTTIKQAGSQEAFRAVDHGAVLAFAWAARRAWATRFFIVTAIGADANSRIFYSRVKGETEAALRVLDFEALAIFQPSFLLGRTEKVRLGERVWAAVLWWLEPVMLGRLRKYRAVHAEVVARAMMRCADGRGGRGVRVLDSAEIQDLGGFGG